MSLFFVRFRATVGGPNQPIADCLLSPSSLLPYERAHRHYDGSLTTPSCAEGVSWFVMWQPVRIAEAQIAAFRELHDGNFRPVQPLGERHIAGAHFEYEGELGPLHWPELSPQWEECGYGAEQSPINFSAGTEAVDLTESVVTDYSAVPLTIQNNGHTVQVDYSPGSTLSLDGETYHVRQFHFHVHSEHQVADASFPMEMHIVHENDAGELAVLGVFMDTDSEVADHAALAAVWEYLPMTPAPPTVIDGVSVNVGDPVPEQWTGWRYDGSLTTPPCSEGVSWTVLETPIVISDEQRDRFAEIFENNARPTQELGERVVIP